MENNITKGFSTTSIYPLDRTAVDNELSPSETYVSRDVGRECGNSSTDLACGSNSERIVGTENGSNSDRTTGAENGSNSERTARAENVPPLPNKDIDIDFQLAPSSSTAHYFVDTRLSTIDAELDVETSTAKEGEEVTIINPDTDLQSITRFLQLPTITERSNPRKRNVDPIVDFTKSIMLTSEVNMTAVQQIQEQNLQQERDKETARILQ